MVSYSQQYPQQHHQHRIISQSLLPPFYGGRGNFEASLQSHQSLPSAMMQSSQRTVPYSQNYPELYHRDQLISQPTSRPPVFYARRENLYSSMQYFQGVVPSHQQHDYTQAQLLTYPRREESFGTLRQSHEQPSPMVQYFSPSMDPPQIAIPYSQHQDQLRIVTRSPTNRTSYYSSEDVSGAFGRPHRPFSFDLSKGVVDASLGGQFVGHAQMHQASLLID